MASPDMTYIRLELYHPNGVTQLGWDYSNVEARIDGIILPVNGVYKIFANTQYGDETGSYLISIQKANIPPVSVVISNNSTYNGFLNFGTEMKAFVVGVSNNSSIQVLLSSVDMTYIRLEIYSPEGELLDWDYSNVQAEIFTPLPTEGCYTVLAMTEYGDEIGDINASFSLSGGNYVNICPTSQNEPCANCADAGCSPTIASVTPTNPTLPDFNNGQITIAAAGANLQYSINGGSSFQTSGNFTGLPIGSYNIQVRNSLTGCTVNYPNPVVLTDGSVPCPTTAPAFQWANAPSSTCEGNSVTLCVAQSNANFNYELIKEMAATGFTLSGNGQDACFPDISLTQPTDFNVIARLKNDPSCFFILDELTVNIAGLSIDTLTKDETINEDDGEIYLCLESGTPPFTINWQPNRGFLTDSLQVLCLNNNFELTGLRAGVYAIQVTDALGCTGSTVAKVDNPNRQRIGFPEKPLLTPNGDGMNDHLTFTGILLYPSDEVELTIYNRYGSVLREGPVTNYDQLWDAKWNGELVPPDTYFYTLRIAANDETIQHRGFITVVH